jgi:hypothetical protein
MNRLSLMLLAFAPLTTACAPDTRMPESGYQWERRQERIERQWRDGQAKGQTQGAAPAAPAQTSTNGAPAPEDRF